MCGSVLHLILKEYFKYGENGADFNLQKLEWWSIIPQIYVFCNTPLIIFNANNIRPHTSELNIHFIGIWIA